MPKLGEFELLVLLSVLRQREAPTEALLPPGGEMGNPRHTWNSTNCDATTQ